MREHSPESRDDAFIPDKLGQYEIIRKIGRGGMGVVLEAKDTAFGGFRHVAVKVLPRNALLDARRIKRFETEALAAASLQHDNIVRVLNRGVQDGVHYFAMDYIQGANLAQIIASLRIARDAQNASTHRPSKTSQDADSPEPTESSTGSQVSESSTQPYPLDAVVPDQTTAYPHTSLTTSSRSFEVESQYRQLLELAPETSPHHKLYFDRLVALAIQAADALDHAHQMGVIHRDIKPSNLMVDAQGRLFVTDFGLAHMTLASDVTRTGDLIGTLRYMSPEQALAQRVVVDHRTDIYSLGITLYELLTLERAYDGSNKEILHQIAFVEPRRPRRVNSHIPFELETIVLKAIEKSPNERYATARELANDLRYFADGKAIQATRPTPLERVTRWSRRNAKLTFAAVATITCVAVIASLTTWFVYAGLLYQKQVNKQLTDALRASEGLRLVASALNQVDDNPGQALILAQLGHQRHPSFEANNALLTALEANHEIWTLPHDSQVGQVCFSRSDQHLATVERNDTRTAEQPLRIWDTATGKLLHRVVERGRSTTSVLYGPAGRYIFTASVADDSEDRMGHVVVWELANLDRPKLVLRTSRVSQLRESWVSRDASYLAFPAEGGTIQVWRISGEEIELEHPQINPQATVEHVAINGNGSHLATLDRAGRLVIWQQSDNGQAYQPLHQQQLADPGNQDLHLEFDATGSRLLSVCNLRVQLWEVSSGAAQLDGWPASHAYFIGGGRRIASYTGQRLQVRDVTTGAVHSEHPLMGDLSPVEVGAKRYVSRDNARVASVKDLTNDAVLAFLRGHDNTVVAFSISSNGERVATASTDGTARIWRVVGYRDASFVHSPHKLLNQPERALFGNTLLSSQTSLTFTHSVAAPHIALHGKLLAKNHRLPGLAFVHHDRQLKIVDLTSGQSQGTVTLEQQSLREAVFTPSQEHAIVVTPGGACFHWQDTHRDTLESLRDTTLAFCVDSHPTEERIAIGCKTGQIMLWTPNQPSQEFAQCESEVIQIAFTPHGKRLVARTANREIQVWDVDDRKQLSSFAVPRTGDMHVSFDGKHLLDLSRTRQESRLAAYELETGTKLHSMTVHAGSQLDLHPTESVAIIGSTDGLQRWNYVTNQTATLSRLPITDVALNAASIYAGVHLHSTAFPPDRMHPDHLHLDLRSRIVRWDWDSGEEVETYPCGDLAPLRVYLREDGDSLWYSGHGQEILQWRQRHLTQSEPLARLPSKVQYFAFSQAISGLVTVSQTGEMSTWDAAGKSTPLLPDTPGSPVPIAHAHISADGKHLVVLNRQGLCQVIDLAARQVIARLDIELKTDLTGPPIHTLQILDEAKRVLIASPTKLLFWSPLKDGPPITHEISSRYACISSTNTFYAILQDIDRDEKQHTRRSSLPGLLKVFSSPTHHAFDVTQVVDMEFDLQGKHLLVTQPERALLYRCGVAEEPIRFPSSTKLFAARFNATGTRFATISQRQAELWDTQTFAKTLVLRDEDYKFPLFAPPRITGRRLGFSEDDRWFFSQGVGNVTRRWPVNPAREAQTRLPRQLTAEERQRFHIDDLPPRKESPAATTN